LGWSLELNRKWKRENPFPSPFLPPLRAAQPARRSGRGLAAQLAPPPPPRLGPARRPSRGPSSPLPPMRAVRTVVRTAAAFSLWALPVSRPSPQNLSLSPRPLAHVSPARPRSRSGAALALRGKPLSSPPSPSPVAVSGALGPGPARVAQPGLRRGFPRPLGPRPRHPCSAWWHARAAPPVTRFPPPARSPALVPLPAARLPPARSVLGPGVALPAPAWQPPCAVARPCPPAHGRGCRRGSAHPRRGASVAWRGRPPAQPRCSHITFGPGAALLPARGA
jgi:hypothetical protein